MTLETNLIFVACFAYRCAGCCYTAYGPEVPVYTRRFGGTLSDCVRIVAVGTGDVIWDRIWRVGWPIRIVRADRSEDALNVRCDTLTSGMAVQTGVRDLIPLEKERTAWRCVVLMARIAIAVRVDRCAIDCVARPTQLGSYIAHHQKRAEGVVMNVVTGCALHLTIGIKPESVAQALRIDQTRISRRQ